MSRHDIVFERVTPRRSAIANSLAETRSGAFWIEDARDRHEAHPSLQESIVADLVVVGGGYTGLWTALLAKERDPELRVVLLEGETVGWAASGRNGGFCEASLTHGEENGRSRWPEEIDTLDRLGLENLDAIEATVARYGIDADFERTGILVRGHRAAPGRVAERVGEEADVRRRSTSTRRPCRRRSPRRRTSARSGRRTRPRSCTRRSSPSGWRASSTELGVEIYEHSAGRARSTTPGRASRSSPSRAACTRQKAVLATNVFPSLLKRNALMTVPVYDYVLMTEPLSDEQLESIGWKNRQGISDMANQFHYYRLSADNRILFGGYDAIYHAGGKVKPEYEERPESFEKLASHFFTTFPQLEGLRFSHSGRVRSTRARGSAPSTALARKGRVAYATRLHRPRRRRGALRRRRHARPAGRRGDRADLAADGERDRPLPFPPEPVATIGINMTRWSLDRADHNEGKRNLLLKTLDAMGVGFAS